MTDVVTGNNRELWLAEITDSAPQWSFLEDAVGTTITDGHVARSIRLGDPINTGPHSTWHQLTWQGGAQQDIWNDPQMYQKGNVDTLSYSGKMKMWPGLQSWFKKEHHPSGCGFIMGQGSKADVDWRLTGLYVGEGTRGPWEAPAPLYHMYMLHPGYGRGDPRAVRHIAKKNEPFRIITSVMSDNYTTNMFIVATSTKMYFFDENAGRLIQDTNAPATGTQHYEFQNDCGVGYNNGFYYGHGNRLYKRIPAQPYGVLGTHTLIKTIHSAKSLQGMCVWNNRIYFGVWYPGGDAAIYVSDGATTVKAFDFPHEFYIRKMVQVAGSLYIIGMQPSGVGNANHQPNLVQQLWRYDGVSLKKLWQEGKFADGANHWFSDLAVYEGMVVWGCQGSGTSGRQTGVFKDNYACLMFYDPVQDAIVPGPGLGTAQSNTSDLNISGICRWNAGLAMVFKDNTNYGSNLNKPYMVATMRQEDKTRNDFRWPTNGDILQFQDPNNLPRRLDLFTSEYHGQDDVANVKKVWLALKLRVKITGHQARLRVFVRSGIDDTSDDHIGTVTNTNGGWQDITIPIKLPTGLYLKSKKIQIHYVFENFDSHMPDSEDQVWVDDMAVQYILSPTMVRQWQIRIPISDNQLRLDGSANPLSTAQTLETVLQTLFFNARPFKFWGPSTTPGAPAPGSAIEVIALNYTRNDARLESTGTQRIGSIAMTLVENVITE